MARGKSRRARDVGRRARRRAREAERLLEGVARVVETRGGARYVGEGALVASSSTPRPEVGDSRGEGLDARRVHARERRKEQQRGGHHRRARARGTPVKRDRDMIPTRRETAYDVVTTSIVRCGS